MKIDEFFRASEENRVEENKILPAMEYFKQKEVDLKEENKAIEEINHSSPKAKKKAQQKLRAEEGEANAGVSETSSVSSAASSTTAASSVSSTVSSSITGTLTGTLTATTAAVAGVTTIGAVSAQVVNKVPEYKPEINFYDQEIGNDYYLYEMNLDNLKEEYNYVLEVSGKDFNYQDPLEKGLNEELITGLKPDLTYKLKIVGVKDKANKVFYEETFKTVKESKPKTFYEVSNYFDDELKETLVNYQVYVSDYYADKKDYELQVNLNDEMVYQDRELNQDNYYLKEGVSLPKEELTFKVMNNGKQIGESYIFNNSSQGVKPDKLYTFDMLKPEDVTSKVQNKQINFTLPLNFNNPSKYHYEYRVTAKTALRDYTYTSSDKNFTFSIPFNLKVNLKVDFMLAFEGKYEVVETLDLGEFTYLDDKSSYTHDELTIADLSYFHNFNDLELTIPLNFKNNSDFDYYYDIEVKSGSYQEEFRKLKDLNPVLHLDKSLRSLDSIKIQIKVDYQNETSVLEEMVLNNYEIYHDLDLKPFTKNNFSLISLKDSYLLDVNFDNLINKNTSDYELKYQIDYLDNTNSGMKTYDKNYLVEEIPNTRKIKAFTAYLYDSSGKLLRSQTYQALSEVKNTLPTYNKLTKEMLTYEETPTELIYNLDLNFINSSDFLYKYRITMDSDLMNSTVDVVDPSKKVSVKKTFTRLNFKIEIFYLLQKNGYEKRYVIDVINLNDLVNPLTYDTLDIKPFTSDCFEIISLKDSYLVDVHFNNLVNPSNKKYKIKYKIEMNNGNNPGDSYYNGLFILETVSMGDGIKYFEAELYDEAGNLIRTQGYHNIVHKVSTLPTYDLITKDQIRVEETPTNLVYNLPLNFVKNSKFNHNYRYRITYTLDGVSKEVYANDLNYALTLPNNFNNLDLKIEYLLTLTKNNYDEHFVLDTLEFKGLSNPIVYKDLDLKPFTRDNFFLASLSSSYLVNVDLTNLVNKNSAPYRIKYEVHFENEETTGYIETGWYTGQDAFEFSVGNTNGNIVSFTAELYDDQNQLIRTQVFNDLKLEKSTLPKYNKITSQDITYVKGNTSIDFTLPLNFISELDNAKFSNHYIVTYKTNTGTNTVTLTDQNPVIQLGLDVTWVEFQIEINVYSKDNVTNHEHTLETLMALPDRITIV